MAKKHYTVTAEDRVTRADKLLAKLHNEYSRAALAKLFLLNLIKIKGESIEPGLRLRPGTKIEYDLGPLQTQPEVIDLPIIYEDDNVIVVDKPTGIISHARGKFWQEASVASFIRDRIKGMGSERGGIVHRLDRATSGVMICAKNEETLKTLQKQFSDRKVEKTYIAKCRGNFKLKRAIIDAPIARNPKRPTTFYVHPEGKDAQTEYEVISSNGSFSIVRFIPKTGRTHQLRVHASYIGNPIVGDSYYDDKSHTYKFNRLCLHAESLVIEIPKHGKKTFNSKVPDEIAKL